MTVYYPSHRQAIEEYSWSMIQHWTSQQVVQTLSAPFHLPEPDQLKTNLRELWSVDWSFSEMLLELLTNTPILKPLYSDAPTSVWELIYALRYALDYAHDSAFAWQRIPRDDSSYWSRTFSAILDTCEVSPETSRFALKVLEWLCWEYPAAYLPAKNFMEARYENPVFYFPRDGQVLLGLADTKRDTPDDYPSFLNLLEVFVNTSTGVTMDQVYNAIVTAMDSYCQLQEGHEKLRKQKWIDILDALAHSLVGWTFADDLLKRLGSLSHPVWEEVYEDEDEIVKWLPGGQIGVDTFTGKLCMDSSGFPTGYSSQAAMHDPFRDWPASAFDPLNDAQSPGQEAEEEMTQEEIDHEDSELLAEMIGAEMEEAARTGYDDPDQAMVMRHPATQRHTRRTRDGKQFETTYR